MLDGLIDIYLPDMKYYGTQLSAKYSNAPDYFENASEALAEMVRQTGTIVFQEDLMKKGVIVRHMVMPGCTKDSRAVIKYLYETYGDTIYMSIMNQYTPPKDLTKFPELGRRVTRREYEKVLDYAVCLGIDFEILTLWEALSNKHCPLYLFRFRQSRNLGGFCQFATLMIALVLFFRIAFSKHQLVVS